MEELTRSLNSKVAQCSSAAAGWEATDSRQLLPLTYDARTQLCNLENDYFEAVFEAVEAKTSHFFNLKACPMLGTTYLRLEDYLQIQVRLLK